MRHFLVVVCLIGCAATASAQDPGPRPFVTGELSTATLIDERSRSTIVGFDATVGGPSWRGFQLLGQGGRGFGVGRRNPTWYGAAGVLRAGPSLWRFRPYAETNAGLARMAFDGDSTTVPLVGVGIGSHVLLGKYFTVDVGYCVQRFFGDADATRARPYLGFGVTF